MANEYFGGGHLRYAVGKWRDDSGDIVDVICPVRCKDCIHYSTDEIGWCDFHSHFSEDGSWFEPEEDDFCSYGERRDNNGD